MSGYSIVLCESLVLVGVGDLCVGQSPQTLLVWVRVHDVLWKRCWVLVVCLALFGCSCGRMAVLVLDMVLPFWFLICRCW